MSSPALRPFIDHPRESWQDPREPVRSSNAFEWSDVDVIPPHFTAAINLPDGDFGESHDDLFGYLRRTQHWYLTGEDREDHFSIGYSLALDWLGGVWELRGDDFECAANSGANHRAFAVLCLVDGNDRLTDLAAAKFRCIVNVARDLSPNRVHVLDHGRLPETTSGTTCAGTGIRLDVDEDRLDPDLFIPPTIPEVSDMPSPTFIARRASNGKIVVGDGDGDDGLVLEDEHAEVLIAIRANIGAPLFDFGSARKGRQVEVTSIGDVTEAGGVPGVLGV